MSLRLKYELSSEPLQVCATRDTIILAFYHFAITVLSPTYQFAIAVLPPSYGFVIAVLPPSYRFATTLLSQSYQFAISCGHLHYFIRSSVFFFTSAR